MDTYSSALDYLLTMPLIQSWPEMQALFWRAAAKQDGSWQLPRLACEAVGGAPEQAIPAVAAVACLKISIILIDDLLDADPRGAHHRLGGPAAANLAAAFQTAALEAIAHSAAQPHIQLAALRSLNAAALTTALGQQWDAQNPADEAAYWRVVETKSAPFFGAAFHVGALSGGADVDTAERLKQLGCLYGEMIQIHDDLHDTLAVPANPDWALGRSPLPILFAQVVEHPDRARFFALRQAIPDAEALAEAQTILIRCGAVSYGVHELLRRHRAAQGMLKGIPLVRAAGLESLLEDQVRPVDELLASLEIPAAAHAARDALRRA